jgi:CheY-like chemotaxis protein
MAKVLEAPLTLRSAQGKGSMFAVDIPVTEAINPAVLKKLRKVQPPALAGAFRVMVIDNERKIVEGMNVLLTGWGNTVHIAAGLDEALAVLASAEGKFDMILADYHLNNEDGISVIRALRTRARRHIPAVLITADRTPAVADLAVAHDVHLLRKPVKPAALRAAMSHVAIRSEVAT